MIIKFFSNICEGSYKPAYRNLTSPKELVTMATRKVTAFDKIMPIDWEKGVIRGVKFMATKLIKELFMALTLAPCCGTPGEPPIETETRDPHT